MRSRRQFLRTLSSKDKDKECTEGLEDKDKYFRFKDKDWRSEDEDKYFRFKDKDM